MNIVSAPTAPLIERAGRAFAVRLSDIPQPWRDSFRIALRGSACPALDGEGECAYAWDWQDWLQGTFPRGRAVEMFDIPDGRGR
ncbi:hypothetical protein [Burkholderia stagnalis]